MEGRIVEGVASRARSHPKGGQIYLLVVVGRVLRTIRGSIKARTDLISQGGTRRGEEKRGKKRFSHHLVLVFSLVG